jgi:membrane-associated phospholipid phosphatase
MNEWLTSLIPWGTTVILWVQALRQSVLDPLFIGATFLGDEHFFLAFLPLVYWCLNKEWGISLSYVTMLSSYVNNWAKLIYRIPRPADPRMVPLRAEITPSFPSGHTQNSTVVWGYLALRAQRGWVWAAAGLIVLLIAVSRVYIGVHFPQDLVGGLILGVLFLALYRWLGDRLLVPWLHGQAVALRLSLAVALPLMMLFIHPADIQGNYPAAEAISICSLLMGMSIGYLLESQFVRFSIAGSFAKRLTRYVVGMCLIALFYIGPALLAPEDAAIGVDTGIRAAHYVLLAFMLSFGAPWLFVRLRLADAEER